MDKSVVFTQLSQREKNISFKMQSLYVCSNVYLIFGGILEEIFRLPGYFELSRVLE